MNPPAAVPSSSGMSSHVTNLVRENVNVRKVPPQSFSFECSYTGETELTAILNAVKQDKDMIFHLWSSNLIFFSMSKKKTLSYFHKNYTMLGGIRMVKSNPIAVEEQKGASDGYNPPNKIVKFQGGRNKDPILNAYYQQVLRTGTAPEIEGDIDQILKRMHYKTLKSHAQAILIAKHYKFDPLPWQSKVVELLEKQPRRHILWIVDPKGNSGKTMLATALKYKWNYQKLTAMDEYHLAGLIQGEKTGFVIDITRAGFDEGPQQNYTSAIYSMIEKVKDGDTIITGSYHGAEVFIGTLSEDFQIIPPKVLVFSNSMPNIAKITLDRWVVFHPKLGIIYLKETSFSNNFYNCVISSDEVHSLDEPKMVLSQLIEPYDKTEDELIEEYIENVMRKDLRVLFRNILAFPNCCKKDTVGELRTLVHVAGRTKQYGPLLSFCKKNNCLSQSIISEERFKSLLLLLGDIDDAEESSYEPESCASPFSWSHLETDESYDNLLRFGPNGIMSPPTSASSPSSISNEYHES